MSAGCPVPERTQKPRGSRRAGLTGGNQLGIGSARRRRIPPRSRRADAVGPLSGEIDSIGINLRRRGRETALGHFRVAADLLEELPRPPGNRFVLRLRQADVLAKTVTLPIAAENHIHQALSFQMDQETPFAPDEIYWSHFITRRDRQGGRLSVRLLLVPRQTLAALLGALARVGIGPNRAWIGDG